MADNAFTSALLDAIQPPEIDAFAAIGYAPNPRQQAFHTLSRQRVNAILYGGSAGSGKSAALTAEAIWNAVNFPGMRIACIRRTYNELGESFLAELAKRGYASSLGGKWNNTDKILKFPNGSMINFTYAEDEKDASRLQGGEYQLFCIDEAGLLMPSVIQFIEERLRSGTRGLPVIGLRCASNPGGIGHTSLRNRFIKPTDYGRVDPKTGLPCVVMDESGRSTCYVPARYTDNTHIDKGYERVLDAIPDPQRRAAMRDGDWDVMSGMYFDQWSRSKHIVPPFSLPKEWQRYCGIDYGTRAYWAVVWCAMDNDGRLWAYRELYLKGVDAQTQAKLILENEQLSGDVDVIRMADPSMWGDRGTPMSIADTYGYEGCGIAPANNDRINGWARLHWFLNDAPACEYHRSLCDDLHPNGWDVCPMLHVFDGHCPALCDTIPALPRSTTKPDDAATTNVEDHMPDAVRYLVVHAGVHSRPVFYDDIRPSATLQSLQADQTESAPLAGGRFAGNLRMEI